MEDGNKSGIKPTLRGIAIGFLALVAIFICYGAIMKNIRSHREASDPTPKYIFLFIGDGMGNSHVCAAESYLSWKAGKLGGEQLLFTQFPELCMASTYSADHQVTCSSASATAFSSGVKTNNYSIGVDPEGKPTRAFSMDLHDRGYNIGIMSSVPINHATPAAFYGHNESRWGYYPLTLQIPDSGYEYFASPGFIEFAGEEGGSQPSDEYLEEHGYTVCWGEDDLRANMDKPHVVLCHEKNRGKDATDYTTHYDSTQVSLRRMLELGIEYLGDEKPFFMMCEGGEVDWCAHENTVYPMVQAIRRLDDAVRAAYEFYLAHPDETLIVVTADHETGGLAIGYNFNWQFSVQDWDKLEKQWVADGCREAFADRGERLRFQNDCGFGWTTNEHTGAPVPVYAVGKGSERFNGRIDNTRIPELILGHSIR